MLNTLKVYIKINICTIHLIGWYWIFEVLYTLHNIFIVSHFISVVVHKRRIKTTIPTRKQSFYYYPWKTETVLRINNNIDTCWLLIYFTICPITVLELKVRVRVMVFNTTFNNISVISGQSLLLVEETGVPVENHWPAAKSLTNFITLCCIEYTSPEWDLNSQH